MLGVEHVHATGLLAALLHREQYVVKTECETPFIRRFSEEARECWAWKHVYATGLRGHCGLDYEAPPALAKTPFSNLFGCQRRSCGSRTPRISSSWL